MLEEDKTYLIEKMNSESEALKKVQPRFEKPLTPTNIPKELFRQTSSPGSVSR